jgi:CheY-like chemotaxis protein
MGGLRPVLVVDNEPGFHDLFRFHLEPLGFDVHSAADGVEGLERFRSRAFDIVFSDVHMPRMKGPELLRKIMEIKPGQRVVMMSSASDARFEQERQVRRMGAVACLFKPFELDELMAAIEKALDAPDSAGG